MPLAKSSFAVSSVMPNPPAAFSPLAMTRSTRWWSTRRCNSREMTCRPGLPMMSPMKRILTGILDGPGLADHVHLDLSRIGHLRLDLLGHVLGENHRPLV